MGLLEDKGLDSSIVCGLYGCFQYDNELEIRCYDKHEDLEVALKYSKTIDLYNYKARIGRSHNSVTGEKLEPYPLGVHKCCAGYDRLYITSNEWDLFTIATIAPLEYNVIAVVNRLDDYKAIANVYSFIHQFKEVVLIPSTKMHNWTYEVKKRLDDDKVTIKTIDLKALNGHITLNDLFKAQGEDAVTNALNQVVDIALPGVSDIGYEDCTYTNQLNKIYTMFDYVDATTGGMILGDVWLLTGFTGCGKTQLSMQLTLSAVQQNHKVFVYSGEIPKGRYLADLLCKVVGGKYIKKVPRKLYGGREAKKAYDTWIEPHIAEKAKDWLKNKYYIYDSTNITGHNEYEYLLKTMELAHKEYGCTMFVVDNLMSLMCSNISSDLNQAQGNFTNKLVEFAKKYNVHIQLVAHPRKTITNSIGNYDIAGSSNIPNLAHVVLSVSRTDEEQKNKDVEAGKDPRDSILECTKNRTTGELFKYPMFFNRESKTFTPIKGSEMSYSWNTTYQPNISEYMSLEEFCS